MYIVEARTGRVQTNKGVLRSDCGYCLPQASGGASLVICEWLVIEAQCEGKHECFIATAALSSSGQDGARSR
jgi:hypothetical protein